MPFKGSISERNLYSLTWISTLKLPIPRCHGLKKPQSSLLINKYLIKHPCHLTLISLHQSGTFQKSDVKTVMWLINNWNILYDFFGHIYSSNYIHGWRLISILLNKFLSLFSFFSWIFLLIIIFIFQFEKHKILCVVCWL